MNYFLDLFSGIGGFSLGAHWAGLRFDGHYFSEVEDYAIRVYQQRFPESVPLGDIRAIRGSDLPAGDWIIAGGFPCQDISIAGKGAGLEGERSGLWFEYARLIGELRPRYAIMENVGALAFRGLDSVLGSLAKIGYDAEWQDIRASDVGAPHRRERIWIVAYPRDDRLREPVQPVGLGRRCDASDVGGNGEVQPLADPASERCGEARGLRRDEPEERTSCRREAVAYSESEYSGRLPEREEKAHARSSCGGKYVTNPNSEPMGRTTESRGQRGNWTVEPDVGGTFNGLSAWLDGFDTSISHELLLTYGKTEKAGTGEILRALRCQVGEEILRGEARGFVGLSAQKVLLSYLCKLQENHADEARLQLEGAQAYKDSLRGLRCDDELDGASYRPGQGEQFAREYTDSLQTLSRLLARHAEKAWSLYRWKNARPLLSEWLPGWEDGFARTSHQVPARVDRLKCLGNSIVPQIAQLIFDQSAFDEWRLA